MFEGRRATIKAHPATPHHPRPYGEEVVLQVANTYGIVLFTINGRLPAVNRSSRSVQFRE